MAKKTKEQPAQVAETPDPEPLLSAEWLAEWGKQTTHGSARISANNKGEISIGLFGFMCYANATVSADDALKLAENLRSAVDQLRVWDAR